MHEGLRVPENKGAMVATPDTQTEVGSVRSGHKPATLNDESRLATPLDSELQTEKEAPLEVNIAEKTHAKEAASDQDESTEYPAAWKLGLITIALCLSVFCVALVCLHPIQRLQDH